MQDSAVAVVLDFDRCVDSASRDKMNRRSVRFGSHDFDGLQRFEIVIELNIKRLGPVKAQEFTAFASAELKRQHTHADKVRTVDSLKTRGDDDFNAQEESSLGGPVTG